MTSKNYYEVKKRSGELERFDPNKIKERMQKLCDLEGEERLSVNLDEVLVQVMAKVSNGISTVTIDEECARILARNHSLHEQYLADRIAVSNNHKNVVNYIVEYLIMLRGRHVSSGASMPVRVDVKPFLDEVEHAIGRGRRELENFVVDNLLKCSTFCMYHRVDKAGNRSPMVNPLQYVTVMKNADAINKLLVDEMWSVGYKFTFRGMEEMVNKEYLTPFETVHLMYLRVAIALTCCETNKGQFVDYDAMRYSGSFSGSDAMQLLDIATGTPAHPSDWRERFIRHGNWAAAEKIEVVSWEVLSTRVEPVDLMREKESDKMDPTSDKTRRIDTMAHIYRLMAESHVSFATPVLYSYGRLVPQGGSCFVPMFGSDSMFDIDNFIRDLTLTSKYGAGLGYSVDNIRGPGASIVSTAGRSRGLFGYSKINEQVLLTVDQGGGRRNGAGAEYMSPNNVHVFERLEQADKTRPGENSLHRLHHGTWNSDEFYRCLLRERQEKMDYEDVVGRANKPLQAVNPPEMRWYIMDPRECPGLDSVYDEKFSTSWVTDEEIAANPDDYRFTALYRRYIREGKYVKRVSALDLFKKIAVNVINFGEPYQVFKDAANRKSNQKNFGVIYSSNLCTEIFEVSSPTETAVCNLASVRLSTLVKPVRDCEGLYIDGEGNVRKKEVGTGVNARQDDELVFDAAALERCVRTLVVYLNIIIDNNFYPTANSKNSNLKRRPIGLGVMGWHTALQKMMIPFESARAERILARLFELLYYTAMDESANLAAVHGPYVGFEGSPISQGKFHFDLCAEERERGNVKNKFKFKHEQALDWERLREKAKKGVRNSLLIAPMPTASTSSILHESPNTEPCNVYVVKSAQNVEFTVVNRLFLKKMEELESTWQAAGMRRPGGSWDKKSLQKFIDGGSDTIHTFSEVPGDVREVFKGPWDVSTDVRISNYLAVMPYVDQGMSFNLFLKQDTSTDDLLGWMIKLWSNGAKNGLYYGHSLAPATGNKETSVNAASKKDPARKKPSCVDENGVCISCDT